MSLALATKGILASGGGPGSPYPVEIFVEKVGDVAVGVSVEDEVEVSLTIEDPSLTVALDAEQEITVDVPTEITVGVEVTEDEIQAEVE